MFESVNPATGEMIATYPALDEAGLERRLDAAAAAFRDWRVQPVAARAALLARLADAYEGARERLAATMTAEMGKTLVSARAEVDKCVAAFRYYAAEGPAMLEGGRIGTGGGGEVETRWQPLGAVLAVMPWNFPLWQAVRFLAPALLAGNVALLKHASNVQGVAGLMEAMMAAADAPPGLFQNLAVAADRVAAIIADRRVAAATVTGSAGAGRAVAEAAGRALKPVVLELGGSDPFVVMPSADLDRAAAVATAARVQNAGQSCICAKRMIVHADIFDAFRDRFVAAMAAVTVGDPTDPASDIGPLASVAGRATLLDQVARMQAAGARLLVGGDALPGPGAYLRPGILADVPPRPALLAEELFGPVAMLFRATDVDDAIAQANATPFGLGASIWSEDAAERGRLVDGIEAGMVAVNRMLASRPEAPFGGMKESGHGRELGRPGLHAFMNLKAVYR